jgi:hypothetical protein
LNKEDSVNKSLVIDKKKLENEYFKGQVSELISVNHNDYKSPEIYPEKVKKVSR